MLRKIKMTEAKDAVCSKAEEVKNVDSETKDQSAACKKVTEK